jgi:hypothetical protein
MLKNLKYSLKRLMISTGGTIIRHLGLLVDGTPNGIGQDKMLYDKFVDGEILVHFPDTPSAIYQLAGWLGPLELLNQTHKVVILCRDSRTAKLLKAKTNLRIITVRRYSTVDSFLARSHFKLCFYVNFATQNYQMLRFTNLIHVYLTHGDSDKNVTTSGQIKAYDFVFVPGQASIDRAKKFVPFYNAEQKNIIIGRLGMGALENALKEQKIKDEPSAPWPAQSQKDSRQAQVLTSPEAQKDSRKQTHPDKAESKKLTVLYAPTWEGGTVSANYGSVETLGEQIVSNPNLKIIFRPHPSSGVRLTSYGKEVNRLKQIVLQNGGIVSANHSLYDDFLRADLLVTDISSVAIDWLITKKPLIITVPGKEAVVQDTKLLQTVTRLDQSNASKIDTLPLNPPSNSLIKYYLGDTQNAQKLFQSKSEELMALYKHLYQQKVNRAA